jgi:hypothetical protein
MSDAAYKLLKIIELEKSGIRSGDGFWSSGSDEMWHATEDLVCLIMAYRQTTPKADPSVLEDLEG